MTDADRTIKEAEDIAKTPHTLTDLRPHERMLAQAISHVAGTVLMTDVELLHAIDRVRLYLTYQLGELRKQHTERGGV